MAIRLAGPSIGVLLSGLAGGLVSSTAVTLNMAETRARRRRAGHIFAAGVLAAGAVMMLRVLLIVGVINVALLPSLALPLLLAAFALAGIAGYLANWGHEDCPVGKPISLQNPFELRVVLEFGALLAVIMAAAKLLSAWAGSEGAITLAAVSGLIDVDAITISLAPARASGARTHERGVGDPRGGGGEQPSQDRCSRSPWAAGRSAGSLRAATPRGLRLVRLGSCRRC